MFDLTKKGENKAKIYTKRIPADKITPVQLLEVLDGAALLESAYSETGKGKYSILMADVAFTLYKKDNGYFLLNPDNKNYKLNTSTKKFLDVMEEFRKRAPSINELYNFPIPLGGIGYLGFEFFNEIENIEFNNEDDRDLFDSAFMFGRNFIIFDHLHDEALLASAMYDGEIENIDVEAESVALEKRISEALNNYKPKEEKKFYAKVVSDYGKEEYKNTVKYIKEEIYKGNLLQCVPSRRLEIETNIDPIDAYRNLRMQNPSPYMFYLKFNDFTLFGASPEVMVKVDDDKKVIVRPIAGTRPRGKTVGEDRALEADLKQDEKELAEHLMLIDLGRNDVGKVSIGGKVKLTEEMIIERYSKVMHIVSEVEGVLEGDKTSSDAIVATFPAGTVSGAPKIQAIKTINKVEKYKRGPYAGLVGYFEKSGAIDSCIAIRSAVYKNGKIWVQAGGGIVFDSDPEAEYVETQNKMLALLDALNIEVEE